MVLKDGATVSMHILATDNPHTGVQFELLKLSLHFVRVM
jgi:hypothetical protein